MLITTAFVFYQGDPSIWQLIIPILFGSVAGTLVSYFFNKRMEREKRALETVKDYFSFREKIGHAKWYMESSENFNPNKDEAVQTIREVGDRLNLIAILLKNKAIKKEFLEGVGVIKDMNEFLLLLDQIQRSELVSKDANIKRQFHEIGEWWSCLTDLRPTIIKMVKEGNNNHKRLSA